MRWSESVSSPFVALAHTAFGAAYQSPQVRAMAEENERAGSDRGAEDLWRRTRDHRDRREGHGGGKRSQRDETREPDDREKHSGSRARGDRREHAEDAGGDCN